MDLAIQYDGTWTDDRYFNIVNTPTVFAPDFTIQNLRVSLNESSGKWGVSAWVKNLADEEYVTHTFDLTVLGYTIQKFGAPRWAGVTVNYNF
jgi:iron complex outermembrane receptor protein